MRGGHESHVDVVGADLRVRPRPPNESPTKSVDRNGGAGRYGRPDASGLTADG